MSRLLVYEFKVLCLEKYINKFIKADLQGKRDIKKEIYQLEKLSDQEKDNLWDLICKRGQNV